MGSETKCIIPNIKNKKKYKTKQLKVKSNNRTIDVSMISTAVKSTQMRHELRLGCQYIMGADNRFSQTDYLYHHNHNPSRCQHNP
ncbi:hypothetical protein V1477_000139 [Vespula maculifrons]|uniref:Uncharacterized protein n=1 Tax=Vespula maculifrons TaxID=7453 RepID=A0ABD2D2P3_VESMC